jgi:hypothetical protein
VSLAVPGSVIRAVDDAVAAADGDGGGTGGGGGGVQAAAGGATTGAVEVDAPASRTNAPVISFFQYHSLLMRYTWRLTEGWREKADQLKRNMTWPTATVSDQTHPNAAAAADAAAAHNQHQARRLKWLTKLGGGAGGGGSSPNTGTNGFSSKVIAMHVRHGDACAAGGYTRPLLNATLALCVGRVSWFS